MNRHKEFEWSKVQAKLETNTEKMWTLHGMERTGGEPDVIDYDNKSDEYILYVCSAESPKGRRCVCYDREALESRKANKPQNNAIDMAADMGIEILTEEQLDTKGRFSCHHFGSVESTPTQIRIHLIDIPERDTAIGTSSYQLNNSFERWGKSPSFLKPITSYPIWRRIQPYCFIFKERVIFHFLFSLIPFY